MRPALPIAALLSARAPAAGRSERRRARRGGVRSLVIIVSAVTIAAGAYFAAVAAGSHPAGKFAGSKPGASSGSGLAKPWGAAKLAAQPEAEDTGSKPGIGSGTDDGPKKPSGGTKPN